MRIRVFSDAENLAHAAAEEIAGWLSLDLPHPTLGLVGGHTPLRTYEQLRRQQVAWNQVHAWMTDERHVPPDDPQSNSGGARLALLDHVRARFHPVPWSEDPQAAAADYEEDLAGFLPDGPGGLQPGLVLLGVGEDGHTASLFPGTSALEETRRGFVANWVPALGAWRLTATLSLLTAARRTMFLVSGAAKAPIIAEIMDGDSSCPAALVSRAARDAVWLLDREAAAGMRTQGGR